MFKRIPFYLILRVNAFLQCSRKGTCFPQCLRWRKLTCPNLRTLFVESTTRNVRYPEIHFIRAKFKASPKLETETWKLGNLWKPFIGFTVCLASLSQEVDLLASFSNLRSLVEGPPVNDTDDISRLPPKTATGRSFFFVWGKEWLMRVGRCWKSFSFGTPSQERCQLLQSLSV